MPESSKQRPLDEMEVFLQSLEFLEQEDRDVFLDQVCARDPALRDGVDRLLRHHFRKNGTLEITAIDLRQGENTPDSSARKESASSSDSIP